MLVAALQVQVCRQAQGLLLTLLPAQHAGPAGAAVKPPACLGRVMHCMPWGQVQELAHMLPGT